MTTRRSRQTKPATPRSEERARRIDSELRVALVGPPWVVGASKDPAGALSNSLFLRLRGYDAPQTPHREPDQKSHELDVSLKPGTDQRIVPHEQKCRSNHHPNPEPGGGCPRDLRQELVIRNRYRGFCDLFVKCLNRKRIVGNPNKSSRRCGSGCCLDLGVVETPIPQGLESTRVHDRIHTSDRRRCATEGLLQGRHSSSILQCLLNSGQLGVENVLEAL